MTRFSRIGALSLLAALSAAQPAIAASTYAATKYPIVLAHGLGGFSSIAGLDYWYGIPGDLRSNGAKVYTTVVSAANSSDVRGEQFVDQVRKIMAVTGAQKVHTIGHSQGSQTVRYAAAVMPGKIASVTSVSGVVFGSPLSDTGDIAGGAALERLLAPAVEGLGKLISLLSGGGSLPQDYAGVQASLSTAGATAFNARFPAGVPSTPCADGAAVVAGTRYYSWHGTAQLTSPLDATDLLLAATAIAFRGEANDGMVGRCGSHLGVVIRDDYRLNHLDTVNQLAGLTGWTDPVALYRQHANRLKLLGL